MTVGELLRRISSKEITEWIAFYALEAEAERAAQTAPPGPRKGQSFPAV